jgi:hypothetical protein
MPELNYFWCIQFLPKQNLKFGKVDINLKEPNMNSNKQGLTNRHFSQLLNEIELIE